MLALPILFGCQEKEFSFEGSAGSEVQFSANTYYQNGLKTKTEYSGYDENNQLITTTSQYERIDWVDNDLMSIYETDGTNNDQLDYKVISHAVHGTDFKSSVATVAPNDANDRLVWLSDNSHTFYSLYPSPETEGVNATKVSLSGNTITASIPTLQVVTEAASGSLVYKPDMKYAYMWAATTAESGSDVSLDFKPLMTAFEITIGTTDANGLVLSSFALSTDDNSTYLAGDFTATIGTDLSSYTVSNITNGSKAIAVTFDNVPITTEAPVTFTVFALPVQLTGLTLTFTFSNGTSKELKLQSRASETDPWEYMTLEGGKKYRLNNLSIPADGWIYTLQEVTTGAAMALHQAAVGTATKGMYSYRTKADDNTVVEEVAMKFEYSPADDTGANTGVWSDNLPAWLTSLVTEEHTTEQDPDAAFTLTGTYTAIPEETVITLNEIEQHITALKANGTTGSESEPKDLALYDITSLGTKRAAGVKTANSYVVDRAGWYMFPLVYGNAIDCERGDANGWNVDSYSTANLVSAGLVTVDGTVVENFKNYANENITSPYILDDTSLAAGDVEAVIVWEDAAEAFITSAAIETSPTTTATYKAADGTAKTVPYIKFNVSADNIRQGNAMIALRKTSDQTIIWSWHIWVTDAALSTVNVQTRSDVVTSNDLLSKPLGQLDDKVETKHFWTPRKYFVRVTQVDVSGNAVGNAAPVIFEVIQDQDPYYMTKVSKGPHFQYGRKDPFLPWVDEYYSLTQNDPSAYRHSLAPLTSFQANKDFYSPAGYTIETSDYYLPIVNNSNTMDVSLGIQDPVTIYRYSDDGAWWGSKTLRNLWNMIEDNSVAQPADDETFVKARDRKVYKTVYDPCPPGFSVPGYSAFSLFTDDGGNYSHYSDAGKVHWLNNDQDDFHHYSYGSTYYANEGKTATFYIPNNEGRRDGLAFALSFASPHYPFAQAYYHTVKGLGDRYFTCFSTSTYWVPPGPVSNISLACVVGVLPAKEIP